MDWFNDALSPILDLLAQIVLACFTVILVIVTNKLRKSTDRYNKATETLVNVTEQMAQSTKLSTESTSNMAKSTDIATTISEKQLLMQRLDHLDVFFRRFFPTRIEGAANTTARYRVIGINSEDSSDTRKEKESALCMRILETYGILAKKVLEDIENEAP